MLVFESFYSYRSGKGKEVIIVTLIYRFKEKFQDNVKGGSYLF